MTKELELAVPLCSTPVPGTFNIGSGFLARRRGVVRLVTAAHVPINRQPYAVNDWKDWPKKMFAIPPGGAPTEEIVLLSPTIPVSANFTWLLGDADTGRMADMIGLHSFHNRSAIERLTDHFRVFDLDEPPHVALGEACTAVGFPAVEGAADWPSYPVRTCAGRVVARTTEMLRVDPGVEKGYSGGPVINAAGQLIGMAIGEDGGLASVVSVEALAVL